LDHASSPTHSHFAHRHTFATTLAFASIAPEKLDCHSDPPATTTHHRSRQPSFAINITIAVRRDTTTAIQASFGSSRSACQRPQRRPSSFILAFVAAESAFAFAEFVPLTFEPFGLGQFASTSFVERLDRWGPSSFAAMGSPAFGQVPSIIGRPCHPFP
jgi:hypothetical protein